MKFYEGRAFTSEEKVLGCEVIGNPAVVGICEEGEGFPAQDEMARVAVEKAAPITVFVKKREVEGEEKEFDVRYFFPDGKEIPLCGHGTFLASKVVSQYFDISSDYDIIYHANNSLLKVKNNRIFSYVENNAVSVVFPKLEVIDSNINLIIGDIYISNLLNSMGLDKQDVISLLYCSKTNDYIIELTAQKLKELDPDFKIMSVACSDLSCKAIFATAKSDVKGFDYENRVFVPHSHLNEDIVCGSAQCALAPLWAKRLGKEQLTCLFPYNCLSTGNVGGILKIQCEDDLDSILLEGEVRVE